MTDTTIPARSLSGDHLGRVVRWHGDDGLLHEVIQRDAFVSIIFGWHTGEDRIRHIHPNSPVSIEDNS